MEPKWIAVGVVTVVVAAFGLIWFIHQVDRVNYQFGLISNSATENQKPNISEQVYNVCSKMQDYYNSVDLNVDIKCDKLAGVYSDIG